MMWPVQHQTDYFNRKGETHHIGVQSKWLGTFFYFHTGWSFQSLIKPISSRFSKLPPSPIIDNIFLFKSLSGLIMLMMYFIQYNDVNILLGCNSLMESGLMKGKLVFQGNLMFTMLLLFHIRLW